MLPNKFATFWYSIFILWLKQSQVINNLLSLFGGIIISSGSPLLFSFSLFFYLPNEVILSDIKFPIKSPVASALF